MGFTPDMAVASAETRCLPSNSGAPNSALALFTILRDIATFRWLLVLALIVASPVVEAYEVPRNLSMGWDGKVQLGALATYGKADTTAISARTDLSYRGESVEHELTTKYYKSDSQVAVARRDVNGDEITDANGVVVKDLVKTTTNDRRYLGAQVRWFTFPKYYVFALADLELNTPADIKSSSRQVAGLGYKLWNTRKDFVSAAVGLGRKKLEQVSGETEEGAIGYVGVRLRREVAPNVMVGLDLDSDFGAENRFSEIELAIAWKLREPISLKFKYEARFNSNIVNPLNTFDEDVEAALSVNIEVAVFR